MDNTLKIEQKWQSIWETENVFAAAKYSFSKKKYYVLEMWPYPSGKCHVGHLRNYAIGDVIARYFRAQGYNVLHPMGWDAFGLPAENAAMNNNQHPGDWSKSNIENMRNQLKRVGLAYDWSREITSYAPSYYKHEQKFFLDLYAKGLAYQKEAMVNWDPVDKTVLANEQVENGKGWRSGALIEKKYLKQWFLKITHYAQELLDDIDQLEGWPENVRTMQQNWIGKSEGIRFSFDIKDSNEKIEVYSTKAEVIFGAQFVAIAYNHPLIAKIVLSSEAKEFVKQCCHNSTSETEVEKSKKECVYTNLYAIHPFNKNIVIPIVIANFVLMDYGTGAVYGCPAHDQRDFELARNTIGLGTQQVVDVPADKKVDLKNHAYPYEMDEIMINSDFLNGLTALQAREEVITRIEKMGIGIRETNFRLRDWGISRQRYWGCPIPIIYCKQCGTVPVPEDELPVELPKDVNFNESGNPLDRHPKWKYVDCPKCGAASTRETDTFDTFFESSWYFTRFCSPHAKTMVDKKYCDYWLPVDQYVGGVEHAVLHLLYARFFTKMMADADHISIREPFKKLLTQGMVLHATYKDSNNNWVYAGDVIEKDDKYIDRKTGAEVFKGKIEKMSKSKLNTIDLDEMLESHGADVLRLFVLSDSPLEKDIEWSLSGVDGCKKFIDRLENLVDILKGLKENDRTDEQLERQIHLTIKNVSEDIVSYRLNKAIARIRELFNLIGDNLTGKEFYTRSIFDGIKIILRLLNPFIPHITEELWERLGYEQPLCYTKWPKADEDKMVATSYLMAIQVDGKVRATYRFPMDASEEYVKTVALSIDSVTKHFDKSGVKKVIIVPTKIINIVTLG